jgi:hypothetical protein
MYLFFFLKSHKNKYFIYRQVNILDFKIFLVDKQEVARVEVLIFRN